MSQRAVLGHRTRSPIAIVREHGSRVEVIGLADWFVPITLRAIADFWEGQVAPHASPERIVLESLTA